MHAVLMWTRKARHGIIRNRHDGAGISYEKRHFWGNYNTWAYSFRLAVILKVLLVNLLAALNFANVFLNKKRLENKKTLKT